MTLKKRIFITGGSGFLGWNIIRRIAGKYELYCSLHDSPLPADVPIKQFPLDFNKYGSLAGIIRKIRPDVIIHSAALSKTDVCEKDPLRARRLNVEATGDLLEGAQPGKTRIIHISTDLVFDGRKGHYKESDPPNPKMVYAETKREAEKLVESWGEPHVILRLALMYGAGSPYHQSFLCWLDKGLKESSVVLFTDEYRTPLYVQDAALAIERLLESDFNGLLHLGGSQRCSRYEFGREYARQGRYDPDRIREMLLTEADVSFYRPPDVSLDSSLAKKVLDLTPLDIQDGIARYFKEVHK